MVGSPVCVLPKRAVDADQVAQVEHLGQRPALLADLLLADHDLDLAGPVPDVEEVHLALPAALDDAPGRLDAWPLRPRAGRRAGRGWSPIGWWPSKRWPHGSSPSSSMRRSFSARLASKVSGVSDTAVGFRCRRKQGEVSGEIWILVNGRMCQLQGTVGRPSLAVQKGTAKEGRPTATK